MITYDRHVDRSAIARDVSAALRSARHDDAFTFLSRFVRKLSVMSSEVETSPSQAVKPFRWYSLVAIGIRNLILYIVRMFKILKRTTTTAINN